MNAKDVVAFEDAVKECVKLSIAKKGVFLLSRDADYFVIGKEIKDALELKGINVENYTLDDSMQNVPKNYKGLFKFDETIDLCIAVGSAELINVARYFCSRKGIKCVAVPTVITFFEIFNRFPVFLDEGMIKRVKCDDLTKIIIDLKIMAGLKKQAFADAFSQVVSKLCAVVEYKAECLLSKVECNDFAIGKVLQIVNDLSEIDSEGAKTLVKIINAQLKMGLLLSKFEYLEGSETSLALILSTIGDSSIYECMFFSSVRLVKLFAVFLRLKLTNNVVTADYNSKMEMLSRMLDGDELQLNLDYEPLDCDEIISKTEILQNDSKLLGLLKSAEKFNERLQIAYGYVYNGRQKRADFTFNQLKLALKLAPYVSGEFLRLINDSGVLESVE